MTKKKNKKSYVICLQKPKSIWYMRTGSNLGNLWMRILGRLSFFFISNKLVAWLAAAPPVSSEFWHRPIDHYRRTRLFTLQIRYCCTTRWFLTSVFCRSPVSRLSHQRHGIALQCAAEWLLCPLRSLKSHVVLPQFHSVD